jgi:hypothetical protein
MSQVYERFAPRDSRAASDLMTPLSPVVTGNVEDDWGVLVGHRTPSTFDRQLNAN